MLSEDRVKELMLKSLKSVKDSEDTYQNVDVNERTIVLGINSPFDSIAITAFITDLEENIEDATGSEYILKVDEILSQSKGKSNLTIADLARFVSEKVTR